MSSFQPRTIPTTLEEAHDYILNILSKRDLETFKNTKFENIANKYMDTLGRWIRSDWGLWDGTSPIALIFKQRNIYCASDMSGIIIDSLWFRLNNNFSYDDFNFKMYRETYRYY